MTAPRPRMYYSLGERFIRSSTTTMRRMALGITTAVIVAGTLSLRHLAVDWSAVFWILPYSLGPLFPTLVLSLVLNRKRCQATLAISSLCYGVYYALLYLGLFYVDPDAQNAIALLLIGLYSLPVMAIFWVSAICWWVWDFIPGNRAGRTTGGG